MTSHIPAGTGHHQIGLHVLRKRRGWVIAVGVLLVLLGVVAVGAAVTATLATMMVIGWLLIVGGGFLAAHAFAIKEWGGFFIDLLSGLLYAVVGVMIVENPAATAVTLTLLIAVLLIVGGVFRIAAALSARYPHSPWLLLGGVVNLALGLVVWQAWPLDGLWVVGTFVGIDLILHGWAMVMLGVAAGKLSPGR